MIYQMTVYYGAMINNKVLYSLETNINDCRKFPDSLDEEVFKKPIEQGILRDGFSPNGFEIRYITKEEYENRETINNERVEMWEVKNGD